MRFTTTILYLSFVNPQKYSLIDQSESQGLIFHHYHGGGERYYFEIIAPGICLFDYDNDNDLDFYFCQGSSLPRWNKNINLENKLIMKLFSFKR